MSLTSGMMSGQCWLRLQKEVRESLNLTIIWKPLTQGAMQLWIATEEKNITLAMVTQIISYPQKKVLRVIAISGEKFIEAHSQFNDMVEAFAIRVGCSSMELWGRKGWKKMLPDWKDSYIVFTKDLKERMH